jgi:hypothetical protein
MEIVVRQMSGLGNQLFQYAAGRYYAARYNAKLRISIDPDRNANSYGSPRPFQLAAFCIDAPMRPANAFEQLVCSQSHKARKVASAALRLVNAQLWREPEAFHFYPQLPYRNLPATLYMRAYWEAAGYAAGVETSLRKELQIRAAPQGQDAATLEAIAASRCPVSVHLRRGDYALGPNILALPLLYYRQAWQEILDEFEDVEFFIFSDDMDYARANLPSSGVRHFISHNGSDTAYQDLRLMAACRHHILANSSFSWWGAWMDPRPDKVVIAPKFWRNSPYNPDLFPPGWRLLDNYTAPHGHQGAITDFALEATSVS